MKRPALLFSFVLLPLCVLFFGFKHYTSPTKANTLTFGGVNIPIDMTSCSSDNSSDGKSRAMAAIQSSSASSCTIQFGVVAPTTGTYTTTIDEDPIGKGKVIIALGGDAFGGTYMAKAGQTISITHTEGKYEANFKDIALQDAMTKKAIAKKVAGSFGCQ